MGTIRSIGLAKFCQSWIGAFRLCQSFTGTARLCQSSIGATRLDQSPKGTATFCPAFPTGSDGMHVDWLCIISTEKKKKNLPGLNAPKTHVWVKELAEVRGIIHLVGPKVVFRARLLHNGSQGR